MEARGSEDLQGKVRLLATQVLALAVHAGNIAEAVLTKDEAHRAQLIEGTEGDLLQLQHSLSDLVRVL